MSVDILSFNEFMMVEAFDGGGLNLVPNSVVTNIIKKDYPRLSAVRALDAVVSPEKTLTFLEFMSTDGFYEVHFIDFDLVSGFGRTNAFAHNQSQKIIGVVCKMYMYHVYRNRPIRFYGPTVSDTRKYERIMHHVMKRNNLMQGYNVLEVAPFRSVQSETFPLAIQAVPLIKPTFKM